MPDDIARAQRFTMAVQVRYRADAAEAWTDGVSIDISRSGVLFSAPQLVAVGTPVQLLLSLSAGGGSEAGADVLCRGRIVRIVEDKPAMAAVIFGYSFLRSFDRVDNNAGRS